MMTKEVSSKIMNFMTPGTGVFMLGHGHISHIVKLHYFFNNLLLYSQAYIKQTKCIVMMTKEGYNKIVNFIQVIAVKMYFLLLYQYTSHWLDYDAAFLYNCWFLFLMILGLLICKYAPFWQEFSVKSLILRWPLRPSGLLLLGKCRSEIEVSLTIHNQLIDRRGGVKV